MSSENVPEKLLFSAQSLRELAESFPERQIEQQKKDDETSYQRFRRVLFKDLHASALRGKRSHWYHIFPSERDRDARIREELTSLGFVVAPFPPLSDTWLYSIRVEVRW